MELDFRLCSSRKVTEVQAGLEFDASCPVLLPSHVLLSPSTTFFRCAGAPLFTGSLHHRAGDSTRTPAFCLKRRCVHPRQRAWQAAGTVAKRPAGRRGPTRAVLQGSQAELAQSSPADRDGQVAAEEPCCCSGAQEARQETEASPAPTPMLAGESSSGTGLQRALVLGSLVAGALVVAAWKPELLPFDPDDIVDWVDEALYFASHEINRAVNSQLGGGDPLAPGLLTLVFGAGLITSFAPCTLSVLPLTIGYIAGFHSDKEDEARQTSVLLNAVFFALGLASTFSALGITAALAGKAYGQMGPGLPLAVSGITMYMGLNLLGLVRFQMPSAFANFDPKEAAASLPVPVQMYLGGMTFALLASPCSTPVLASLLGFVASSEDVLVGFALLLTYTFGRVMPVLVAASFTGSMKQMLSLRKYSKWINPASGALLLGIGTFSALNRAFPEAAAMALGMGMSTGHT